MRLAPEPPATKSASVTRLVSDEVAVSEMPATVALVAVSLKVIFTVPEPFSRTVGAVGESTILGATALAATAPKVTMAITMMKRAKLFADANRAAPVFSFPDNFSVFIIFSLVAPDRP